MKNIKLLIKYGLRKCGLDLRKFRPDSSPASQIISAINKFKIDLIIDVGANEGQFGCDLRNWGYKGNIVSFEPLSIAYKKLINISSKDSTWKVHSRCALGSYIGDIKINIAGNLASSSILPMLKSHVSAAPNSAYMGTEIVPITTLDEVIGAYTKGFQNILLKVDTQGFEWEVLNGATKTQPHLRGILIELSLVELYKGQHLWNELMDRLKGNGFTLWSLQSGFVDPINGQTLQVDGLFFRINE